VRRRFDSTLSIDITRADLATMSREELEELAWRRREALRALANRLGEDSKTSSRPPSSDDPYRRGETGEPTLGETAKTPAAAPEKAGKPDTTSKPAEKKVAKPAGKRPGAKGCWRSQPIVTRPLYRHAAAP
jgi:septal ring-binding cell division protein DamX